MKIVKIGDCYLNWDNITHAEFDLASDHMTCTVYFNCHVTEIQGHSGVQASRTFTAAEARDLKAWLELRAKTMEPQ
jgi:hypothetical protein